MQDLAILCANCHRMVHAKTKWLTLLQDLDQAHVIHDGDIAQIAARRSIPKNVEWHD